MWAGGWLVWRLIQVDEHEAFARLQPSLAVLICMVQSPCYLDYSSHEVD